MDGLTAVVLTYNERENVSRLLDSLSWISRVVIVDSYSTDGTTEIAGKYPNITLVQRPFDSFAGQCNFGLSNIETEWVLSLDADYVVTAELSTEIRKLDPSPSVAGYAVDFDYIIFGRALRSSLYPARTVLYRRQLAQYRDEGHGHRVTVNGQVEKLSARMCHDDRKPLSRWIQSQDKYAIVEADHLLDMQSTHLEPQDRLRLAIYFAPAVMFFYLLFGRGLIFDGWRGWYYVCQRVIAELLLSIRIIEQQHKLERLK